jgi:hypothetical protein
MPAYELVAGAAQQPEPAASMLFYAQQYEIVTICMIWRLKGAFVVMQYRLNHATVSFSVPRTRSKM